MERQTMPRSWPTLATIGLCALAAGIVAFWGAQDKQGQFQIEMLSAQPELLLFYGAPYVVLAACAWCSRRDGETSRGTWFVAMLLAVVSFAAYWADHRTYLHTPPGRETAPMASFLATILLWLVALVQLVALGVRKMTGRRRSP